MPDHLHVDHVGTGLNWDGSTLSATGGGDYVNVESTQTINTNDASYMVNTTDGAITITAGTGVDHFTVFDANSNFAMNNCTVSVGGDTKVLSVDGEFVTFFKDEDDDWRYMSLGVANTGAV